MKSGRWMSAFRKTIAFAVVIVLLVLIAQGHAHTVDTLAPVVFVPDFLFGQADVLISLWSVVDSATLLLPQAPAAEAAFQRPTPSIL